MHIRDKVAVVTGAGSGIGRAIALRLADEGAALVVADVDHFAGNDTVREIKEAEKLAAFVQADVALEAEAKYMVAFTEEQFGGLDILVNNAGGVEPPFFPEGEPAHWGKTIDVNLR